MKKSLILLLLLPLLQLAQINITSWKINNTGHLAQYYASNGTTIINMTDSSEVQQVCYNTDTVWVRTDILGKYIMGPWPGDPHVPSGQDNSYIFPRNPLYTSTAHPSKPVGIQGLLINGVAIYDDGDGKSYNSTTGTNANNGAGVWNSIAWVAHYSELDAGMAHPDANGVYHNHSNPIQLCSVSSATAHSPLIGWAFDGNPIYGPFGYSVATNSASAITRMTSSWSLRSISTRTALYTGSVTSQAGPSVSATFPLGTYIEDYQYVANSGMLDYYNGRQCVTPEFPGGTYAYFLNTDASGNASYPNMVGPKYYGAIYLANFGASSGSASAPKLNKTCYVPATVSTLTVSITSTSVSCNGSASGSATVSASGGTTYTYSWTPSGGTSSVATGLSAGTYSCLVTSGTLSATQTVTISQPTAALSGSLTTSSVTCYGSSTGSISLTASGGSPAYTYSWSTGATSQSVTGLAAGSYSVRITDSRSCTTTVTTTVTQASSITLSYATTSASCSGSGGAISLTVSGGTSPYTYTWSNSAHTQSISSLTAGTYSVLVMDTRSCTSTANMTVTAPSGLTLSATANSVACSGSTTGSVNLSVSGSTSYTYSWSNGATTQNISGLSAGVYSVLVTAASGCTAAASATVGQTGAISVTLTPSSAKCNGTSTGSVSLSYSGGTGTIGILWSNGATTSSISSLAAGAYSVTLTDANSCSVTATTTVSQPAALAATVSPANVKCYGASTGSAAVTVSGGTSPYTYSWSTGALTSTINGLAAGSYSLSITDANSCSATATATISQPSTSLTASMSSSSVGCYGASTGSAIVTAGGGTSPYTYLWSTNATASSITSLPAGSYSVTVTDANSCVRTSSALISQPSTSVSASAITGSVSCNGGSNGSVSLTVSGGTSPYSYSWSTSAATQSISSLAAGNYSVTITDANACTRTLAASVAQPALISVTVTTGNIGCASTTGSVGLTVNGGTSPYSYLWSNSATTSSITSLSAGSYSVTITDGNGCTKTASATVAQSAASLTVAITSNSIACFGGTTGSVSASVSGGISPYTYLWSNSAVTSSISGLSAGVYSLTVTDAASCSKTTTVALAQAASSLVLTMSSSSVGCYGAATGSAAVSVSGGASPYLYVWNNSTTSSGINSIISGTYAVTVTDNNSCSKTATVAVLQPAALSATAVVSPVRCNGASNGSVTLNVSGGTSPYTYLWSNSATTQSNSALAAGNYSVTLTDAHSCTTVVTATVNQPAVIQATATAANINCFGASTGSVSLTVSGGVSPYTYLWNTNATTASLSALPAGNYSVTVTDANSCTKTVTALVTQPAASVTAAVTTGSISCNGTSTGSLSLTVSGGTSPYTYLWNTGATASSISALPAGSYSVIVTDANGCTRTVTVALTQPAAITASAQAFPAACNGASSGSVNLIVNGGTSPYTYQWSNAANTQTISGLPAAAYSVTITDSKGCIKTASATVLQPPPVSATVSVLNVSCYGGSTGSASVSVNGGVAPYTYSWSNNATGQSIPNLSQGTYSVTITDSHNCTRTATAIVNQPASPLTLTVASTNVLCNGASTGSAGVIASGGTSPYSYQWSNNASTQIVASLAAGAYSVAITDAHGCTGTGTVSISQPPALTLSTTYTNVANGNDGAIDLTVNGGTAPYQYAWSNSASSQDLSGLPSASYSVTVTDTNGCTGVATVTVGSTVGLKETAANRSVRVYPNPVSGLLHIAVDSGKPAGRVEIIDYAGRLMFSSEGPVSVLDMSAFDQGIYTVRFVFETATETVKLIKN